jgi:hypothetical protein
MWHIHRKNLRSKFLGIFIFTGENVTLSLTAIFVFSWASPPLLHWYRLKAERTMVLNDLSQVRFLLDLDPVPVSSENPALNKAMFTNYIKRMQKYGTTGFFIEVWTWSTKMLTCKEKNGCNQFSLFKKVVLGVWQGIIFRRERDKSKSYESTTL